MTKEEAYGINVSSVTLFSSSQLGKFDFNATIPLEYKGKEFRIIATLNWDYTGVNAYWWAHRYVNDIGCEGILGGEYGFLYSDGVVVTYPDGNTSDKFSWKSSWPTDGKISFRFTKDNSYLALWFGSLIGDSSVSGEITKEKLIIRKNESDTPLEFTSFGEHYLIAGEGEVSIVPEIRDKNGTILLHGWGNLTDEIPPQEWNERKEKIQNLTKKILNYIWTHKIEIAGGIFIKITTGIPGFVLTLPTKYAAKALGYLSVPPSYGQIEEFKKIINAYNTSVKSYGIIKTGYGGCVHFCKLYVITNDTGMSVYMAEGNATLEGKNESVNITTGEYATVLKNGSVMQPKYFNEDEIKEKTGLSMDTLWKGEAKRIEIKDYILCKGLNKSGFPRKATTKFTNRDTVYAWLSISNASIGDKIRWIFEGPNSITHEEEYAINWSGDGYCYAHLSLNQYGKNGIGQWMVTAYINDEKKEVAYFYVKSSRIPCFEFVTLIAAILIALRRRN